MFLQDSQAAAVPPPMPADPYMMSSAWSTGMLGYHVPDSGTEPLPLPGPPVNEYSEMAHVAPDVSFGQTPVLVLHV